MVEQIEWLKRTFPENLPSGVFPTIVERFRGTPARIEDLVGSFPSNKMTERVNGKWSIQEHIGHLCDLEELNENRLREYLSKAEYLSPADLGNRKTEEANHNAGSLKKILSDFRRVRMDFVAKLERLTEEEVTRKAIHPRLKKPMRLVDWVYFMAEHDDHHIAMMTHGAKLLSSKIA